MNSRRFVLMMAALTAVFCGTMVFYNFHTQPPYGQAALTVAASSGAGVSGTLPVPASSSEASPADSAAPISAAGGSSAVASIVPAPSAASSKSSHSSSHTASAAVSFPIHINTATAEELAALPGVGDVIAGRIVDYRTANGPFKSVDELDNVKGIGAATLAKIRPYATV